MKSHYAESRRVEALRAQWEGERRRGFEAKMRELDEVQEYLDRMEAALDRGASPQPP